MIDLKPRRIIVVAPGEPDYQLSDHFNTAEFRCKGKNCCGGRALIDTRLVEGLEKLRSALCLALDREVPIALNSAYRCPKHNSSPSVKGVSNSAHMSGEAADVNVAAMKLSGPSNESFVGNVAFYLKDENGAYYFQKYGEYPVSHFVHLGTNGNSRSKWLETTKGKVETVT